MLVQISAGAAALSLGLAYAVRAPASSILAPSVHRGTSTRRAVALTFDDGPSESTPKLLGIIDKLSIPATFFQCGYHARRLKSIAASVAKAGHEIGNHTENHRMLFPLSPNEISDELQQAQHSISWATGCQPKLFRAPFGVRWFGLCSAQRNLGLTGVMWTGIGLDWKLPVEEVVARLLAAARPGAILCLHDGRGLRHAPDIEITLQTVQRVVPLLIAQGYHFETVSQILCPTTSASASSR